MINAFVTSKSRYVALVFSIALLAILASCQKAKTTAVSAKGPKIVACALITNEEVQAIQGSPIKDVKDSEQSDGSFRIAQCFYNAETFNKSVSLAVTQTDPASAKSSRLSLACSPSPSWWAAFLASSMSSTFK